MKYKSIIYYLLIVWSTITCAQDTYYSAFLNPKDHINIFNNSFNNNGIKLDAQINYRTYIGKLAVIRSQYAGINYKFKKNIDSIPSLNHNFGVGIYSDKEGDFFSRNRLFLNYSLQLPLNNKWYISGGFSEHIINYSFSASGSGASGSEWAVSHQIAASINHSNFKAGISVNDFNNTTITPISYSFTISRFYTTYMALQIPLKNYKINFYNKNTNSATQETLTCLGTGFTLPQNISIAYYYTLHKGSLFNFSIDKLEISPKNIFAFSINYFQPQESVIPNANSAELCLKYFIP